jgi:hypothetical protein
VIYNVKRGGKDDSIEKNWMTEQKNKKKKKKKKKKRQTQRQKQKKKKSKPFFQHGLHIHFAVGKVAVVMKVMALDDVPGVVKEGQGDSGREVDAVPLARSSVLACSHRVVPGASESSRRR